MSYSKVSVRPDVFISNRLTFWRLGGRCGEMYSLVLLCNRSDESWQTDSNFLWRLFISSYFGLYTDSVRVYWCETASSQWKSPLHLCAGHLDWRPVRPDGQLIGDQSESWFLDSLEQSVVEHGVMFTAHKHPPAAHYWLQAVSFCSQTCYILTQGLPTLYTRCLHTSSLPVQSAQQRRAQQADKELPLLIIFIDDLHNQIKPLSTTNYS